MMLNNIKLKILKKSDIFRILKSHEMSINILVIMPILSKLVLECSVEAEKYNF